MAFKIASFNGCKVYDLSSSKKFDPSKLSENKKRELAKDDSYRRRLELIQDFEVSIAAQCIKLSPDGEHIIVTGTYPPIVKCFTTSDMSLKFQRGLDCEVVAFECLSADFGSFSRISSSLPSHAATSFLTRQAGVFTSGSND